MQSAKVTLAELEDDLSGLWLECDGKQWESCGSDFFEAFCDIRRQIANEGWIPNCYGASRSVMPSGMSRRMDGGTKAYKLKRGHQARSEDLVHIFDTGPDIDPASVGEQAAFYEQWLKTPFK